MVGRERSVLRSCLVAGKKHSSSSQLSSEDLRDWQSELSKDDLCDGQLSNEDLREGISGVVLSEGGFEFSNAQAGLISRGFSRRPRLGCALPAKSCLSDSSKIGRTLWAVMT